MKLYLAAPEDLREARILPDKHFPNVALIGDCSNVSSEMLRAAQRVAAERNVTIVLANDKPAPDELTHLAVPKVDALTMLAEISRQVITEPKVSLTAAVADSLAKAAASSGANYAIKHPRRRVTNFDLQRIRRELRKRKKI